MVLLILRFLPIIIIARAVARAVDVDRQGCVLHGVVLVLIYYLNVAGYIDVVWRDGKVAIVSFGFDALVLKPWKADTRPIVRFRVRKHRLSCNCRKRSTGHIFVFGRDSTIYLMNDWRCLSPRVVFKMGLSSAYYEFIFLICNNLFFWWHLLLDHLNVFQNSAGHTRTIVIHCRPIIEFLRGLHEGFLLYVLHPFIQLFQVGTLIHRNAIP